MTDLKEQDIPLSETARPQAEGEKNRSAEQSDHTSVQQTGNQGDGKHGRPSDDSDPGHS